MRSRPRDNGAVELTPPSVEGASAGRDMIQIASEASVVSLDDADTALIQLLLQDGRMSNRELAAATGIGEANVGVRLKRLVASRVLIFTALFDWEVAGFDWFVVAKIHVEGRTPKDVAEDVALLPECEVSATVFGDADVLAYFLVTDRAELNELIERRLADIPGVTNVRFDLATRSSVTALGRNFYLAKNVPPIRLPRPAVAVDELDASIMQALVHDGRQSNRKIARELAVSEGTVRSRINRLTDAGLLRIVAMIEPLALGMMGVLAHVGFTVDRGEIATVSAVLEELPQMLFTALTIGSADLTMGITGKDQNDMVNSVLNRVRSLKGVRSMETLQIIDIVRFSVYVKRLS
ncbi:Lrp/AsnC family transcriptional regulator [Amycolatopsis silviterrae]|uniref:Lrp/AsnC family transcriptional regulator n=1 Tax=Amycolatopsis silviterrae TaxID=1656914 RepID=A0ABW5HJY5_9PSEU